MNPGPVEEGAKVAGGIVDALRQQPLILALIVMNVLIFAAIFYAVQHQRGIESDLTKMRIQQTGEAQKMLASCIPVDQLKALLDHYNDLEDRIKRETPP